MKYVHMLSLVYCAFCASASYGSGATDFVIGNLGSLFWQCKKMIIVENGYVTDEHISNLGSQAQLAVGIAPENCVPIKNRPDGPFFPNWALAIATPDAIFVNQELIAKYPESLVWFDLLHEATHVKYRDQIMFDGRSPLIWSLPAAIGAGLGLYTAMVGFDKLCGTNYRSAFFAGLVGVPVGATYAFAKGMQSLLVYMRMAERRADTEAAHACACKECLQEVARYRSGTLPRDGVATYLSADEIRAIADATTTTCARHQAAKTAPAA